MTRTVNTLFAVTDACAGCGACLKTCPEKAIRPAPKDHDSPLIVLADRCSGCAECAEVCPVSACVEINPGSRESGGRESENPLASYPGRATPTRFVRAGFKPAHAPSASATNRPPSAQTAAQPPRVTPQPPTPDSRLPTPGERSDR